MSKCVSKIPQSHFTFSPKRFDNRLENLLESRLMAVVLDTIFPEMTELAESAEVFDKIEVKDVVS